MIIRKISRQHIGGVTKKKDQPEWMTDGPSAELSLVRTLNLIIRVACALVVCRISGSRIGNAELSSVWIRLHWLINMELVI